MKWYRCIRKAFKFTELLVVPLLAPHAASSTAASYRGLRTLWPHNSACYILARDERRYDRGRSRQLPAEYQIKRGVLKEHAGQDHACIGFVMAWPCV